MVAVYVPKAADLANIRDRDPVLDRLVRKDHIRQFAEPDQDYLNLTFEGRQRVYDARPSFWQLLSGK